MRRFLALAAAIVLLGSCGTVTQPQPSASSTVGATATSQPTPSADPVTQHAVVYLARDRLAPVAVPADGAGVGETTEARVLSRMRSLFVAADATSLVNIARRAKAQPRAVGVDGDLATVDFAVPGGDWGVNGSAAVRSFLQQLVFTATEEPTIRRALFTQNGKEAVIGGEGVVIDHAATREDVAGYGGVAMPDAFAWRTEPHTRAIPVTARITVGVESPALVRLVVDTGLRGADAKASIGVNARLMRTDERAFPDLGKWTLSVSLPDARTTDVAVRSIESTPVRAVHATNMPSGVRYDIGLDDARPWRVAMLYEPLRVIVDIGGDPDAVSANIALYRPPFGGTVRAGDEISGFVRAFEARYQYRVLDARGTVIVDSFATASLGTAEMWGVFSLAVPTLPEGPATLEILLRSPKDGSVSERVSSSFTVAR